MSFIRADSETGGMWTTKKLKEEEDKVENKN